PPRRSCRRPTRTSAQSRSGTGISAMATQVTCRPGSTIASRDISRRRTKGPSAVAKGRSLALSATDQSTRRGTDTVNTLGERTTRALMVDLMSAALRIQEQPLNALAIELFGRFGQDAVRHLVLEAVDRKNPPAYRLRLLQALDRIGAVRDAESLMVLFLL